MSTLKNTPGLPVAIYSLSPGRSGGAARYFSPATAGHRPVLEYSRSPTEDAMEALKDATHLYEVERRDQHAARPGFRIQEIQISRKQKVPWHYHNNVQDTFYVLKGNIRLFLREPKEEIRLGPGETYTVKPRRPHLVTNGGEDSATFLVLQGIGEYDFIPLV
jgi:quercetin dioxygenase-like cupin family protein